MKSVYFVNSLCIHYLFCQLNMNSESVLRIHYVPFMLYVNSLWSHYFFLQNHYELTFIFQFMFTIIFFCWFTMDSLSFSRIHYEIMKSLSVSWINNWFIMFLANSLWIHYLSREYTINALSVSRLYNLFCEYTNNPLFVSTANSLWIHYFFTNSMKGPLGWV